MSDDAKKKVTYYLKELMVCPVCENEFEKEEMLTGGGRMNAGKLTDELHRTYQVTMKFGEVYPLIYPVATCPKCYYSAYMKDFEHSKTNFDELRADTGKRKNSLKTIFPNLDFTEDRRLQEGIASYFFAIMCYDSFNREVGPTFKQAQSALRAAWLCKDLHRKSPEENYDYLSLVFYRKAGFFYNQVVEKEQTGEENMASMGHLGPDTDNNFGYDGVIYLSGFLEYKYGQRQNPERRAEALKRARSVVSRIVGMGKSSKSKPSAILDLSRELHKSIKEELEALGVS